MSKSGCNIFVSFLISVQLELFRLSLFKISLYKGSRMLYKLRSLFKLGFMMDLSLNCDRAIKLDSDQSTYPELK